MLHGGPFPLHRVQHHLPGTESDYFDIDNTPWVKCDKCHTPTIENDMEMHQMPKQSQRDDMAKAMIGGSVPNLNQVT